MHRLEISHIVKTSWHVCFHIIVYGCGGEAEHIGKEEELRHQQVRKKIIIGRMSGSREKK